MEEVNLVFDGDLAKCVEFIKEETGIISNELLGNWAIMNMYAMLTMQRAGIHIQYEHKGNVWEVDLKKVNEPRLKEKKILPLKIACNDNK